jgi:isopentenyl-diphosphate delta-isomerase
MMPLTYVGHSADQMVDYTNQIITDLGDKRECNQVIVSGGMKDYLDGFYAVSKLNMPSIYGQAAPILKRAIESEEVLNEYLEMQFQGFSMAKAILKVK